MKKILPIALIGGGVYLALRYFNGLKQTADRLLFSNPRLKFGKATASMVPCDITIDVTNPTGNPVSIDYFHGQIFYQGKAISTFTFQPPVNSFVIQPRQVTTLPFTVQIKNLAALSTIKNILVALFTGKKVDSIATVKGNVVAAGMDLPISFSYDVEKNVMVPTPAAIGTVKVGLEFSDNSAMEKYFQKRREGKKLPAFSKN